VIRRSRGEKIFGVFNLAFLLILSLAFVVPFISIISTSLIGDEEWARRGSYILFPQKVEFTAYRLLFTGGSRLADGFINSVSRIVVGTALNLVFTSSLAYVLSKRGLPGRVGMTVYVFITMVVSGGLIPLYFLVDRIGLTNTFWAMVIPVLISPWNMLIMRNFFMALPESLEEAAIIDGATPLQCLLRIVLPLSTASIATIGLFYAVYHWNEWFNAYIYINDTTKLPLQVILRNILIAGMIEDTETIPLDQMPPAQSIKTAMIVVTVTPILCVYPFIQRYFVKGVMIGGIKG
jgi:putative aldouronate transport system permease protein